MDVGARDRRPPEIHFPDAPMMAWKATSGKTYIGAKPWSSRIPPPYAQAYDLGTPMAPWVTKMQQAWRSLSLVLVPGRVMDGSQTVAEIADSYDRLRTELQFTNIPPAAYYLAQRRDLHERHVVGPTVSAGWSSFVASEAEICSTNVLILGASGSRIYTTGSARKNRSIIDHLKDYQGWPNLHGNKPVGAGPEEWRASLIEFRDHEHVMTIRVGLGWHPCRFAKNEKKHHIFESIIAVIIDDHNGLCDKAGNYVG